MGDYRSYLLVQCSKTKFEIAIYYRNGQLYKLVHWTASKQPQFENGSTAIDPAQKNLKYSIILNVNYTKEMRKCLCSFWTLKMHAAFDCKLATKIA